MRWMGTPSTGESMVARLHGGEVAVLPPTEASRTLARMTRERVRQALGVGGAWEAVQRVPEPYGRLGAVRRALATESGFRSAMAAVARSAGFDADDLADAPRLRSITAGAERAKEAAAVYLLHRDTWYGCPPELLVAWVPLQDTPAEEMFAFYPDWFARPVANTSAQHDQNRWMDEVGWHGDAPLSAYASPEGEVPTDADAVRFDVDEASIVLFSAAQLHQTRPVPREPWTRYSVDFRLFPTGADTRAPRVDDASRGAETRLAEEFSALGEAGG